MKKATRDFVKSLKETLSENKEKEIFQRNLLNESLEYFISILKGSNDIDVRSIKNFETNEITCFLNLYCESENIPDSIDSILNINGLKYYKMELDHKRVLYLLDFGKNLKISGKSNNWFFIEFYFKSKHLFEAKMRAKNKKLEYSIFDKKYYHLRFWLFDNFNISVHDFPIKNLNRNKQKIKEDLDEKYSITLNLGPIGEVEKINISRKRGKKQKDKL